MKPPCQNFETQEDDYKTKNQDFAFFKPPLKGRLEGGLKLQTHENKKRSGQENC
jgi:hypothetical protein